MSCINPSQFMVDFQCAAGGQENIQDYVKREPGYDVAFCNAWEEMDAVKDNLLTDSQGFLALLDKIHKYAISHLPGDKQGRSNSGIFFALIKNQNSNEQGIKDIIKKIWINREPFHLIASNAFSGEIWRLSNDAIYDISEKHDIAIIENKNLNNNEVVFDEICGDLIKFYNQDLLLANAPPLIIYQETNINQREQRAIQIIDQYFCEIKTKTSTVEKITTVCAVIRDLSQLHLYIDGNGRSLYMMANLLLYQNGLESCYPRNMCIFEGNSLEKQLQEVEEGQQRFTSMFESLPTLTKALKDYRNTVKKLEGIVKTSFSKIPSLNQSVKERNFNLMLRQAAAEPQGSQLLELLLENKDILAVNIFSQGSTSGNALHIASKYGNTVAIELLKKHGFSQGFV